MSKLSNVYYALGGEIDSTDILARKRRKRTIKPKNRIMPITGLTTAVVVSTSSILCSAAAIPKQEVPKNLLDFEIEVFSEQKSVQEQVNDFIFWGQMKKVNQNMKAQALMEEAVKAQVEEEIRAKNFFSTMREMSIEGKLSVKLAKISDNLNSLSALTEQPKKAKELEAQIASQIEKLKQNLAEYPTQFGSLKLSLKSERKRLKEYKKLRREYEEAMKKRLQEIEGLKNFYNSFNRFSDVSRNLGISKEHFREIMAAIHYGNSSVFQNNADFFWELAEKYDFNEFLIVGICAWESGWAADPIEANNFSSQRKKDGSYFSYETENEGIEAVASNLAANYLPINGKYYNGKSLDGINVLYCQPDPDHEWAKGVADCMLMIVREYLAAIE